MVEDDFSLFHSRIENAVTNHFENTRHTVTMQISTSILFLALLGFSNASCPPVDETCMNEENHATCQALHEDGCQNIRLLESCPLQFHCVD